MSGIAVRKTAVLTEPAPSQDMPMTETATETPIVLTESAARRISEIAAAEASNKLLRVSVEGGGCSGFQYKFDLVADSEPDDLVIERNGAKVLIDPVSVEYMAGSEIDFVDDLIGASFKINNPNATAGCGCGTSFSI
jgi:iron-sulfur cluster assembly accessory protein